MNPQSIVRIVGYVTTTLIFVLGIILVFIPSLPVAIPSDTRRIVGILMMVYSVFRFYTIWKKSQAEYEERR